MAERWERRARKVEVRRRRMPVHGKALAVLYENAIRKRASVANRQRRAPGSPGQEGVTGAGSSDKT